MINFRPNYNDENYFDIALIKDDVRLNIVLSNSKDLLFEINGYGKRIDEGPYDGVMEYTVTSEDSEYFYFENLINNINKKNKEEKNRRRNLVDEYNTINWYSDDIYVELANLLSIKKEEETITLSFYHNKHNDLDFGIPVYISNNGSRYQPFNESFMKLYLDMQAQSRNRSYTNRLMLGIAK